MNLIKCWSCDKSMTINERIENDGDCIHCGVEIEMDLDFRRANNIFEVGDAMVIPSRGNGIFHFNALFSDSDIAEARHATPEEIKAGKRL